MPFTFEETEILKAMIVTPRIFEDDRGFFMETYKYSDFKKAGISENFIQDNHSYSTNGTLRGLHFQKNPTAQGKLVRVVCGEIFDVAVDLMKSSPTYGNWIGTTLSSTNHKMLYVPPWCAHGFFVTSETAEVVYKTTNEYSPEDEGGIMWNDSEIAVRWPPGTPSLSDRDKIWPSFANNDSNF